MTTERDLSKPALTTIREIGGVIDNIDRHRAHPMIKWSYKGRKEITVCPVSSSDRRAELNLVAAIKRRARAIDNELA